MSVCKNFVVPLAFSKKEKKKKKLIELKFVTLSKLCSTFLGSKSLAKKRKKNNAKDTKNLTSLYKLK
jgi:hypothetical protein